MPPFAEFVLDPSTLLLLAGVAFVAGFIDAIAGGGGLLTIPALLTAGLPPHLVLGTNKLCASFGSATASLTFYRRKLFDPAAWRNGLCATAIGALAGAMLASWLPPAWLQMMLPVVVSACALYLLFANPERMQQRQAAPLGTLRQWPQGLALGFYDGAAGPGTGAFWTVSNLLLYPLDLLRASGVARSMNFVSNAMAFAVFAAAGQVHWLLGICMGLALMAGAFLGARSAIAGGARLIRPLFILMVLALSLRLIGEYWFAGA
jgi:uncharacterized membrane protein YfcA